MFYNITLSNFTLHIKLFVMHKVCRSAYSFIGLVYY